MTEAGFSKTPLSESKLPTTILVSQTQKASFLEKSLQAPKEQIQSTARALSRPQGRAVRGNGMGWFADTRRARPSKKVSLFFSKVSPISLYPPENLHCRIATIASWILRYLEATALLPLPSSELGYQLKHLSLRHVPPNESQLGEQVNLTWHLTCFVFYYVYLFEACMCRSEKNLLVVSLPHGSSEFPFHVPQGKNIMTEPSYPLVSLPSTDIFSFLFIEHLFSEPWVASQGLTPPLSSAQLTPLQHSMLTQHFSSWHSLALPRQINISFHTPQVIVYYALMKDSF